MKFLINYKNKYDKEIFDLYKKNYDYDNVFTPEYRYNSMLTNENMWFHLVNENNDIIAACSVDIQENNTCSINDVLVEEKFRGNNYAVLLLVNLLYHFDILNIQYNYSIKAHADHIAAVKTYTKVFGEPIICKEFAYFNYKIY